MKNKFKCLLSIILLFLFSGCSTIEPTKEESPFVITASFYPIYLLCLNIADGIPEVEVRPLAQPQIGCLHDYELTAGNVKTLQDSGALITNGAGMEDFLEDVSVLFPNLPVVDSSLGILTKTTGEASNSHIWLNVNYASQQVQNITEALVELDPAHEQQYRSNAKEFLSQLSFFQGKSGSFSGKGKNVVVFHEAFDYIAEQYEFKIAGSLLIDENIRPTPKKLGELIEKIRENHVTALFAGDDEGMLLAKTISAETGIPAYFLDPITYGPMDKEAFIQILHQNDATIKEAFSK